METNPPADALADTIGHGNEVAGLNNDGGKAAGGFVSMDYRTARSGEGCGDWFVQQSVRAVRDIG